MQTARTYARLHENIEEKRNPEINMYPNALCATHKMRTAAGKAPVNAMIFEM